MDIIETKIKELIALAEVEGDVNVQIVMLILHGSRLVGDDGLLAAKVKEFAKDVLRPRAIAGHNAKIARDN